MRAGSVVTWGGDRVQRCVHGHRVHLRMHVQLGVLPPPCHSGFSMMTVGSMRPGIASLAPMPSYCGKVAQPWTPHWHKMMQRR